LLLEDLLLHLLCLQVLLVDEELCEDGDYRLSQC